MIETAYEKGGWLYARIDGYERCICSFSSSDRLEGFTSSGITYVKNGWRYIWHPNGSEDCIGTV